MSAKQITVTVCELPNDPEPFAAVWAELVAHVREHQSDVVVLPEMPFAPWLAWTAAVDAAVWDEAVGLHEEWLPRLAEFGAATVLSSRPVVCEGQRLNEAFVWHCEQGYTAAHHKYYLPDEPDFWEATWYERGQKTFEAVETPHGRVGFLLCSEIWFTEHARAYGQQGAHLLVCPRATEAATAEKWVMGGRAAAVVSGAYGLSSNRGGVDARGHHWGGHGWVI
ncbi:MAG: carbon-nitrogen hydrolase family protein, partial [Anaerolineales bacterium]|nr:carbon-nitrogen hydrolase family protein [Anaerolineales bacterium]